MFRLIEALNFRCLRYVRQPLEPFHVLIGPNASGKSTFLDVAAFLGRLVTDGLDAAISERTQNFYDLLWGREGNGFELAVEADIPQEHQSPFDAPMYDRIRYEVGIGLEESGKFRIVRENILLGDSSSLSGASHLGELTGEKHAQYQGLAGRKALIHRSGKKYEYFVTPEVPCNEDGDPIADNREERDYERLVRANSQKPIFGNLNEDEFPACSWLEGLLRDGVYHVALREDKLRNPSPPGKGTVLREDGGNLPWIISRLKETSSNRFFKWLEHVRTALPDLRDIGIIERPEDKHRYLMIRYGNGLEVPSWMVSDGTLRLLALTLLPYDPDAPAVCLIEEPENSIHPLNIEAVVQSLQSVYSGQVLVATHSPAVLAATRIDQILVFSRDDDKGTRIVNGKDHPELVDWKGQPDLSVLFASGVMG